MQRFTEAGAADRCDTNPFKASSVACKAIVRSYSYLQDAVGCKPFELCNFHCGPFMLQVHRKLWFTEISVKLQTL